MARCAFFRLHGQPLCPKPQRVNFTAATLKSEAASAASKAAGSIAESATPDFVGACAMTPSALIYRHRYQKIMFSDTLLVFFA